MFSDKNNNLSIDKYSKLEGGADRHPITALYEKAAFSKLTVFPHSDPISNEDDLRYCLQGQKAQVRKCSEINCPNTTKALEEQAHWRHCSQPATMGSDPKKSKPLS